MTQLNVKFMTEHPLRRSLKKKDWRRIQKAIDNKKYKDVSDEEIQAATDVFYDAIAGRDQTHMGVTTLQ